MNPTATDFIHQYHKKTKEFPTVELIVQNCVGVSFQEAEEWLERVKVGMAIKGRKPREAKKLTFADRVIQFTHGLQYFAFFFASIADMALAVFFYYSLGFDMASRIALGVWGIVMTGGKLYSWANRRNIIALWACALSVVATVSIFLAVIDTQSDSTNQAPTTTVSGLEAQIKQKMDENATLSERLAKTPTDYVKASKAISDSIAENDKTIAGLRAELSKESNVKKDFSLDAWKIFSQLTNFKWSDPSHWFALILILSLAVFFEMLIYVTIPHEVKKTKHQRA